MMILTHSTSREKVSGAAYAEKKEPPIDPRHRSRWGETLAWGEPYAHPYQGFIIANPMPIKSPHQLGPVTNGGSSINKAKTKGYIGLS